MSTFVIRHPRRGVYIGVSFNHSAGKETPRFSLRQDRVGGGVQFATAIQAQHRIIEMTVEKTNYQRCYAIRDDDPNRRR